MPTTDLTFTDSSRLIFLFTRDKGSHVRQDLFQLPPKLGRIKRDLLTVNVNNDGLLRVYALDPLE